MCVFMEKVNNTYIEKDILSKDEPVNIEYSESTGGWDGGTAVV